MNSTQAVCNYALLRFLPYPETEEFVNVGVLLNCDHPCLLHFLMETKMSERVKTMFPDQNEEAFEAAATAMEQEMKRVTSEARDPKSARNAFNEAVRPRESVLRFGEPRTILTSSPKSLSEELFNRYVRRDVDWQPVDSQAVTSP